jgi:WD40 repeat protein
VPVETNPVRRSGPASPEGEGRAGADVFVSYSRRDISFASQLHVFLAGRGKDVWIDAEDIPASSPWRAEIAAAIDAADNVVFVVSPDSVRSEECTRELEYAEAHGKRIVPIVCRETDPHAASHAVAELNWIFARDGDDRDAALETLLRAIETDLQWLRAHTRLLVRAVEWDSKRRDASLLLRGTELHTVERLLAEHGDADPAPTALQREYVVLSRRASTRRQRITLVAVIVALAVSISLGILFLFQRNTARSERDRADAQARLATSRQLAAQAVANLGEKFDLSLLLAKAAQALRDTPEARASLFRTVAWTPRIRGFLPAGATVRDVAFGSDGKMLAAGAEDGRLILWETASLHREAVLGAGAAVTRLRFTRGSRVLVVGRRDGSVEIWGVAANRRLRQLAGSLRGAVVSLALADGGRLVAAGDAGGRIVVWANGSPRLTLHRERPAIGLAFARGGKLLVVGDALMTDALFDLATGKKLPGHARDIALADGQESEAYASDARRVAVAGKGGFIHVKDALLGGWDKQTPGSQVAVEAMAFDGNRLLSVGQGTLALWDISGKPKRIVGPLRGFSGRSPRVALAHGVRMAAVANGTRVIVWNLAAPDRLRRTVVGVGFPPATCCEVAVAAFSPDGRRVSWYHPKGVGRLLTTNPIRKSAAIKGIGLRSLPNVSQVLYSADGRMLVAVQPTDINRTAIVVRDPSTLRIRRVVPLRMEVSSAAFIRRSSSLVAVGVRGSAVAVNPASRRVRRIVAVMGKHPNAVAVSPNGTMIAEARADGTVVFWDTSGNRVGTIRSDLEPASIALSKNGGVLAIASTDGTTMVWDSDRRKLLRTLQLGAPAVFRFSPDGRILASATAHGIVSLWDVESGAKIGSLAADRSGFLVDIAFNPKGNSLFSAGADGVAYLWTLDDRTWGRIACAVAGRDLSPVERRQFLGKYAASTPVC